VRLRCMGIGSYRLFMALRSYFSQCGDRNEPLAIAPEKVISYGQAVVLGGLGRKRVLPYWPPWVSECAQPASHYSFTRCKAQITSSGASDLNLPPDFHESRGGDAES
jgi:hypothetical protein